MDGVKVALGKRGMMVEAARQCAKYRKQWNEFQLNEFQAAIFARHCVLSDRSPTLRWLSHEEGRDAVT